MRSCGEGGSGERERAGGGGTWCGPERRNQVPLVEGFVGVPSLMKNSPVLYCIVLFCYCFGAAEQRRELEREGEACVSTRDWRV